VPYAGLPKLKGVTGRLFHGEVKITFLERGYLLNNKPDGIYESHLA